MITESTPLSVNYPRRIFSILGILFLILVGISLAFYLRYKEARGVVSGLVNDPAKVLKNTDSRTNLLLLGMGGEGHSAPNLTDSMIFVSLSHDTKSITMITLPRDIWVPTLKAKINTAYHYGRERRVDGGRDLAKSAVSEILGQPVHYVLSLDFAGFVSAVDAVGGIDVTVERAFDDYKYPILGKENAEPESARYEHLHFDSGLIHMDGATALRFARSRHAEGEEGTDYARSARQQKIILAFKDKVLQSQTLFDGNKLKALRDSVASSLDTDIQDNEFAALARFFLSFNNTGQSVKELGITDLLESPKNKTPYDGQWVLIPANSLEEIHQYVRENIVK